MWHLIEKPPNKDFRAVKGGPACGARMERSASKALP